MTAVLASVAFTTLFGSPRAAGSTKAGQALRSLVLPSFQRRGAARLAGLTALGVVALACGGGAPSGPVAGSTASSDAWVDRAAEAGLAFTHQSGISGSFYYNEMMGGGVALLDYDGDGDLDVYFTQGRPQGGDAPAAGAEGGRLFRNDLPAGAAGGPLHFTDVTDEAQIVARGFGMGAAVGDVDGDGRPDLYLTNFEANQLWHNRGDGTFEDWTARAGVGETRWSVPAVFADFDRDGDLDLFVGNYVDFTLATHKRCTTDLGLPNYCGPLAFRPYTDTLYRNRGDGSFEEVADRLGLNREYGGALGALVADFNRDGWPDLYVGNDGLPNQLWINQGGEAFVNDALLAGCAVNQRGAPEASMGMDAADFDHDGDEDLVVANLSGETNVLYVNRGDGTFDDRTAASGLGPPSLDKTSFGIGWLDYDNDGWLDLLAVSGAVRVIEEQRQAGERVPLQQTKLLFHNRGDGTFADVTAQAGRVLAIPEVSRGAAFGDLDNDGDTDVVVSNLETPARLLLNQVGSAQAWLGLRLLSRHGGGDALGAWVVLHAGERVLAWRRVRSAASYASANDPRLLFGLGKLAPGGLWAEVHWPDGAAERFDDLAAGRYSALRQGTGQALAERP